MGQRGDGFDPSPPEPGRLGRLRIASSMRLLVAGWGVALQATINVVERGSPGRAGRRLSVLPCSHD